MSLTFTVPLPPRELSSNARVHWREKAGWTRAYRYDVYVACREAKVPSLTKARVSLEFAIKGAKGRYYQPRDEANAVDSFKAGFDGMIDAEVLPADSRNHLALGEILINSKRGPFIEVTVEAIE